MVYFDCVCHLLISVGVYGLDFGTVLSHSCSLLWKREYLMIIGVFGRVLWNFLATYYSRFAHDIVVNIWDLPVS